MHTFDEIIGILRANFYVCIIYLYILQICILYTTTFGDSSCRSVPIRRRNFRIIPLYDVRETNNIPLHGFANYSIYYKTTTRSRCVLCILRVVLILASTTTLVLVVVLAIFRNRSTTLLPDNRRTSVRPWRRLRNDPVESRGLLPPTDIEKITEKKKGSPGPVQLFFRGKPRRRGKWLVVTGICIAALRRKPKIGLIESNRIESNRIESMPLVSRPALWFLLFLSLFCLFCPLFVFFWPKQSRVFFLPNFPKSAVVPFPQDEEEYAAAITKKFNWDILRDCDNGATLRTYLSRRLHCDP